MDDSPLALEKALDEIRWDKLSELTVFSYFEIETILAFLLKVEIVERWQSLDSTFGTERLEKLLTELGSKLEL